MEKCKSSTHILKISKIILITLTVCFLNLHIVKTTCAQQTPTTQIKIEAEKTEVLPNEPFQLTITINSTKETTFPENLTLPGIENFNIMGQSISTQIRVINGQSLTSAVYNLNLTADMIGQFTLGPVEVLDEKNIRTISNTININVSNVQQNTPKQQNIQPNNQYQNKEREKFGQENYLREEEIETNETSIQTKIKEQKGDKNTMEKIRSALKIVYYALWIFLALLILKIVRQYYKKAIKHEKIKIEKLQKEPEKNEDLKKDIDTPKKEDTDFYKKLKTQIVKKINEKYKIKTDHLTTEEIVKKIKNKYEPNWQDIEKILKTCDTNIFSPNKNDKEKDSVLELIKKLDFK